MGIFEAGLLPGVGLYLTNFYSRKELALRYSCLFACSGMAGALGGLISYLIGFMKDVAGLQAWRWIFILEGIPTVILGVITFFVLANDPESAKYLSEDEKHLLQARRQRQAGYNKSWDEFKTRDAIKGAKDWKVLIFCAAQFCGAAMLYGYSTFLPTIILQLGTWDRVQTNAMTIPCYALGVVTYIIAAWLSDRYQTRGLFPAGFGVVCVLGYGILLSKTNATAHYIGCLLVGMGLFVFVGMPLSYLPMSKLSETPDFSFCTNCSRSTAIRQKGICIRPSTFHLKPVRCYGPICESTPSLVTSQSLQFKANYFHTAVHCGL